jgi:hypothetical protein
MSSKFKFPIYKDRAYTLDYDDFSIEVTGEEILAQFRREAFLLKFIEQLDEESKHEQD